MFAVAAGTALLNGGMNALGSIAQNRAISQAGDLSRIVAQREEMFRERAADRGIMRNRRIADTVAGRIAASAAARNMGQGGSVDDLLRAAAFTRQTNENTIQGNLEAANHAGALGLAGRLSALNSQRQEPWMGFLTGAAQGAQQGLSLYNAGRVAFA
jgi:hypothetical protein